MSLSLNAGTIASNERTLLVCVPDEIQAEADPLGHGLFLAARAKSCSSRHLFGLGAIPALKRFTACHRYEPYWMKPRAGTRLSDVPQETQFLLCQLGDVDWFLLVPLVGDLFRFSLRGKKGEFLELLGETGDSFAPGSGGLALYVAAGRDPFALVRDGARSVVDRLRSGRLRRDKVLPDFIDYFGWCTWDAFYQEVSAVKVRQGLEGFAAGGVLPRLLILDDGWQTTRLMPTGERRLASFAANEKFDGDLRPIVRMAKSEFGVEVFLVWHAIIGYWGGVDAAALPGYGVVEQTRQFGEGVLSHAPSFNEVWWGNVVGFVPCGQISQFYDDYHRSLAGQGVDGVKVDSQAVLESVAQRQGGRIAVNRAYRAALEDSATRHFRGRLINCMSNAQETWYGSTESSILRSSIDFFPDEPETHGMHLYANAQVGLWFGEFMRPDWDMFQSGHEWGAFHAASRAISGGPVYVSDKPGQHDFGLLRKLVCFDGTVLRCEAPARPTLDTLCADPTHDDCLLKIWNRNGGSAVIGVFNARFSPGGTAPIVLSGVVGPADVPDFVADRYACYAHQTASLAVVLAEGRLPITLGEREFELFTIVPIERGFAAIGLADKLNSAGALARIEWLDERCCELLLRDGGDFLAWSEVAPTRVELDGLRTDFDYDPRVGTIRVSVRERARHTLRIRW
jgi:raffinose synthase